MSENLQEAIAESWATVREIRDLVGADQPPAADDGLAEAIQETRQAVREVRSIVAPEKSGDDLAEAISDSRHMVREVRTLIEATIGRGDTFERNNFRVKRYNDVVRIYDLTNAGKRGKKVDVFTAEYPRMGGTNRVEDWMDFATKARDFDKLVAAIQTGIDIAKQEGEYGYAYSFSSERGVDVAPAGFSPVEVNGQHVYIRSSWDTFSVRDKDDQFNLPTCIPAIKGGKKSIKVFYRWVQDNARALQRMTFSDVLKGMRKAGIDYHQYCAMD